ncbi:MULTISPECIES: SWIM zinc finger family protein [unclassified Bradyrhizobium]
MVQAPGRALLKSGTVTRFDVAVLRDAVGEKAFVRGRAYHLDGRVEIIAIDKARVVARVVGTDVYRCEVKGQGRTISGNCTCRAYGDWGSCKHMAATALAANSLEPAAVEHVSSRLGKIRNHLRAKSVENLVEMVLKLAEKDTKLFEQLGLSAELDTGDETTLLAGFKKAITGATRVRGYIEYRDMRDWTRSIDGVLDHISGLLEGGRASLVLELLDHFFARMDDALTKVDDSDGGGGACYVRACEIHVSACEKSGPDPIELARTLFVREVDSDSDFFFGASETYADILGEAGLAEYRRLATMAWRKVKSRRGRGAETRRAREYAIRTMLERFAERDNDIDAIIAIRSSDLSSAGDYLSIAQVCLDNGREQEALKWAEEGLWKFEDDPDRCLVLFACDLLGRNGRNEDANKLLWRMFSREPSVELYQRLKSTASDRKQQSLVRDGAITVLNDRAAKSGPQTEWVWLGAADVLVRVLMLEGLLADAWAAVGKHGCREDLMEELARASEPDLPDEALKAYAYLVERKVRMGGQANYGSAHALIKRMRRLDGAAQHSTYLADLMMRHKAKQNFIKLLTSKQPS